MRAAVVTDLNGPDGVVIREVADPIPEPGQVLIDVEYAGISFPDVLQTRGHYQVRPDLPFTPGWEISGVVREDSGSFRAGERVAAMPFTGGVAESVVVDANYVFPLPDSVSFATAAALPLNYLTAHFALVRRAKLQPGETVLVQGAAGGVGSASCNMAAALGARVIAVVSSTERVAIAEAAGAHHVVLADGFAAEVRQLTDGRGVDVIVDPVGGERFTDSLRSLAREGRLLVVGFAGGQIPSGEDEPFVAEQYDRHGRRNPRAMEPRTGNAAKAVARPAATAGVRGPGSRHRFAIPDGRDCLGYPNDRRTSFRR